MANTTNFSAEFFADNRRKLREAVGGDVPIVIGAHGLIQKSRDEAFTFRQESNFWYLSGVDEPDFTLVMDNASDYLIAPQRSEYLDIFSGGLDKYKIKQISGVADVLEHDEGWSRLGQKLEKSGLAATLKPLPGYIGQLGFYTNPAGRQLIKKMREANGGLKLVDARIHLAHLRAVKTDTELKCIRRATDESIQLHQAIAANLPGFHWERDVAAFIQKEAIEKHLQPAYAPITAGGKNAAILHYDKAASRLSPTEPLLVDAAFSYARYCSDITRTYCLEPSERYRQIYAAVLNVQEFAIRLLRPGVKLDEYEKLVRRLMGEKLQQLGLIKEADDESISKYYPHRTSHWLGLDAHDAGDPTAPLAPGMVLSVEPGIYVPSESIGVRIEDVVLITDKGNEVLSAKLPKTAAAR